MEFHNHKFNPLKWKHIKGYIYPTVYTPSDTPRAESLTARTTTASIETELKNIKVLRAGILRAKFSYYLDGIGCEVSFYRNDELLFNYVTGDMGGESGTETIDVRVAAGDNLRLTVDNFDTGNQSGVSNFYLKWDYEKTKLFYKVITN